MHRTLQLPLYHYAAAAADGDDDDNDAVKDIKNSYRAAMMRGLPQPIVYTLAFFCADDGGFVWQRAMRSAGHFSYIIFWYDPTDVCNALQPMYVSPRGVWGPKDAGERPPFLFAYRGD